MFIFILHNLRTEEDQQTASSSSSSAVKPDLVSTSASIAAKPAAIPVPTTPTTNAEMSVVSKELSPANSTDEFVNARPIDEGLIATVYSFVKKASVVGAVYFVGYMGWSVAWLIGPVILSVIRDQWRRESDRKRNDAKVIAQTDEKRVILARLNDLPSWVSIKNLF